MSDGGAQWNQKKKKHADRQTARKTNVELLHKPWAMEGVQLRAQDTIIPVVSATNPESLDKSSDARVPVSRTTHSEDVAPTNKDLTN